MKKSLFALVIAFAMTATAYAAPADTDVSPAATVQTTQVAADDTSATGVATLGNFAIATTVLAVAGGVVSAPVVAIGAVAAAPVIAIGAVIYYVASAGQNPVPPVASL